MALDFDLTRVIEPVAPDAPCGPDLDLAGDPDYMHFVAGVEIRLPESFFAFDAHAYDFASDFKAISELLPRTRDLRLLVLVAKLGVLGGDLGTFGRAVQAIRDLLDERWEEVHPAGEDGDFTLRLATLSSLDDRPHVIVPLASAPLVSVPRFGQVTWRHAQIAAGAVSRRDEEDPVDGTALRMALGDADPDEIAASYETLKVALAAAEGINRLLSERIGPEEGRALDALPLSLREMLAFLRDFVPKGAGEPPPPPGEDAAAAAAPVVEAAPAPPPAAPAGPNPVRSATDADRALGAVIAYFQRAEPSNPALILTAQARTFINKSFVEALALLAPEKVARAAFRFGNDDFVLRLDAVQVPPPAGAGQDGAGETPGEPFEVEDRAGAAFVLQSVRRYYEANEPSSPIPVILDRALGCLSRDFMTLVTEFAPSPPEA